MYEMYLLVGSYHILLQDMTYIKNGNVRGKWGSGDESRMKTYYLSCWRSLLESMIKDHLEANRACLHCVEA